MTNLQQRLCVSTALITIISIATYISAISMMHPIFLFLVACVIGGALWEYYRLATIRGYEPMTSWGITFSIAYLLAIYMSTQYQSWEVAPLLILGLAGVVLGTLHFSSGKDTIANYAISLFGIGYIAVTLSCIVLITFAFPTTASQDGRWWLFYLLATSKMTDVGAYFTGKIIGRRPLAPVLSPKKTREGAIGGALASIVTSILFATLAPPNTISLSITEAMIMGISISIIAQLGDLVESALKRDAGVKHSNSLPGLGGLLDVVDSLIFTAPLVFLFLKFKDVIA